GRTPNSFQQNPVDFLGGVRIFPRRWFGFSAAYRGNLNQQGRSFVDIFKDDEANDGFPAGFRTSDDPHGFIFQVFAGRRNLPCPDCGPAVDFGVTVSQPETVVLPKAECTGCYRLKADCPKPTNPVVTLNAEIQNATVEQRGQVTPITFTPGELATDFEWTWEVTGGPSKVMPDTHGATATLDFTGAEAGEYTVEARASYVCPQGGCLRSAVTKVRVERPDCCEPKAPPTLSVSCPPEPITPGEKVTLTANVSGGDYPGVTPNCSWDIPSVSADKIERGANTCTITIDTTGLAGQITATVTASGYPPDCAPAAASCSFNVPPPTPEGSCRRVDAYGAILYNDEKARLDSYAIEFQNEPSSASIGYIVAYRGWADHNIGTKRVPVVGDIDQQYRIDRAVDYLVNCRGIARDRIKVVDGGDRKETSVELYICPSNVAPTPTPEAGVTRSNSKGVYKQYPPCPRPRGSGPQPPVKKKHGVRKPRRRTVRGS
ncbi:MAG: hypothetical protein JOZ96_08345, partial [Acidobacteria bacterium]|nr:hypothetical protein [Acidobacteriota bacterium]